MKIKKEKIEKIILNILTLILIVYISLGFTFFSIFNISKKIFNSDNVSEFVSNIDVIELLKDELGNKIVEFSLIENEFKNVGITSEAINEFMNSEDVKEFYSNKIMDIFDGIINNSSFKYIINIDEVTKLIEENIDTLKINSSLSEKQLLDKLNSNMPNIVSKINELIDNLCEELENSELFKNYQNYINMSVSFLDIIYSNVVFFIILIIPISFILILLFISKSICKSLKYASISFIITSILLYLSSYIALNYINISNNLINSVINKICNDLNMHSLIYIILTIHIIVINIIIYVIKKEREKNI